MKVLRVILAGLWLVAGAAGAQGLPIGGSDPLFELGATPQGPLLLPTDVAIGRDGRIYVVDSGNHRLVAFDGAGKFLFAVGRRGGAAGEFMDPVGIATDARGNVYVADKGNGRVQIFDHNGAFRQAIAVTDASGAVRPVGVVVSEDGGQIFVSGNVNHNIMVFGPDGALVREWGREGVTTGQFRYPASLALRNERLYVVDGLNSRVQIFSEAGRHRFNVGEWGVLQGQLFRPKGVAIDNQERIYVSDGYMDVVQVYGSDYRLLHVFGARGTVHRFKAPGGLAVDRAANRLFVVEMLANRVAVFQL